jgi:hypothetical membrane protein
MNRTMLTLGIVIMVLAMVIGPFLSHPGYSSLSHTTSELAGQNMPHAWIMRIGFAAYGLSVALSALNHFRAGPAVATGAILFGLGLIGAALWSSLPSDPTLGGTQPEDTIHSFFASALGTAFVFSCLSDIIAARPTPRPLSWFCMVVSIVIPLTMLQFPDWDGLLQRAMFTASYFWVWRQFARP